MPSEPERYWGSICLGIVTIATAAIGVALFGSGLVDVQIPDDSVAVKFLNAVKYSSAVLAVGLYLGVLFVASKVIVPATEKLPGDSATTAKQVLWVYALFVGELLSLLVLLAADILLNWLSPPAMPAAPMALLLVA